jgi:glycosyltransferase involved in cell wall biosynthesis
MTAAVRSGARRRWTVVQLIPRLSPGGAERSTLEVARALVDAGHRSIVISSGGRWVARLKAEGSEHIQLPVGEKSLGAVLTTLRLRSRLNKLQPDLVHVRSRLPAWMLRFALLGWRRRPALVSTVHGLNSVSAYSRILTQADRVIAVSQTTRDHLLRHYPGLDSGRIRIIPRGVDPFEFPPDFKSTREARENFFVNFPALAGGRVLTLPGRGTRLKGHADGLQLLALLRERKIDARLLLLGVIEHHRHDYVDELRQIARELGVSRYVAFSEARGDVREAYAASDLVLQLSVRPESFGRIVTEALSQGRPVLGYDHGGVGELLRQFYPAGAVPLRDLNALCERAIALLEAPPPVNPRQIPTVTDLQRLTLSVYAELIAGAAVDPAFDDTVG